MTITTKASHLIWFWNPFMKFFDYFILLTIWWKNTWFFIVKLMCSCCSILWIFLQRLSIAGVKYLYIFLALFLLFCNIRINCHFFCTGTHAWSDYLHFKVFFQCFQFIINIMKFFIQILSHFYCHFHSIKGRNDIICPL